LLLSYAAAAFFAGYCGLLQSIWNTNVTYMTSVIMTSVIGTLFVAASWRFDSKGLPQYPENKGEANHQTAAIADSGLGRTASSPGFVPPACDQRVGREQGRSIRFKRELVRPAKLMR
jgi:hypothetical protein